MAQKRDCWRHKIYLEFIIIKTLYDAVNIKNNYKRFIAIMKS